MSVIDPNVLFDIEVTDGDESVLVFDPDMVDGAISWAVDEVKQVTDTTEDEINDHLQRATMRSAGVYKAEADYRDGH